MESGQEGKEKVDPQARFALVDDSDLLNLLEAADSKNTKRQIKYSVNVLQQYAETRGSCSITDVESMTNEQLDSFLSKFYPALRKENGQLYTKKSMQGIRYGLQRHFQKVRDVDIVKNPLFTESNKSFKAMLVKLKDEGLGYVKHKSVIPQDDFNKISASKSLDITTPRGLQNKVFIDLMLFLCNRGQENLRSMKPSDFLLATSNDGTRSITRRDMLTKNNREDADEITGGMMCEIPGDERCPVKSFLEYVSKLNPDCPAFWQKPKEKAPDNPEEPWFCNIPVGINTLNKKMKDISKEAGCSKVYTNHCLRATCVTVLDHSGFKNRDIMTVSGHHSEQSIKHYSRTDEERKRQMSAAIAKKAIGNQPCTSTTLPAPNPATNSHNNKPRPKLGPMTSPATISNSIQPIGNQPCTSATLPVPSPATNSHAHGNQPRPRLGPVTSPATISNSIQPRPSLSPLPSPSIDLDDLAVLTDSQEQRILQDIDITNMTNAFSMNANSHQTLNFHGCTVNFYNSHQ